MSARCISEPISWLRLERYHLGELGAAEREAIASHLAACPVCAACFATIGAEEPALRPLDVPRAAVVSLAAKRSTFARRAVGVVGALSMAAAIVLAVGHGFGPDGSGLVGTSGGVRSKGGDVSFTLVRDDDQAIVGSTGTFDGADRFKVVVTCPTSLRATFDVAVFDTGGTSFPLQPTQGFECGNGVPLPGAFRLTGPGEETVCLTWTEEGEPDRGALAVGEGALSERSVCKRLLPDGGR